MIKIFSGLARNQLRISINQLLQSDGFICRKIFRKLSNCRILLVIKTLIFKKIFLLLGHFGLVCKAVGCLTRSLKAKNIAKKIPAVYDEKKLAKWTKKYNRIICKN